MVVSDNRKTKNDSALELQHVSTTLILDRMQKGFALIVLLCCAAPLCRANETPPAWVNAVDTNAMERVLYYMDNLKVLTCSNVGFPLEININNNK